MDRLQSIRLFVRTVQLGSFSDAAIEANVSQSSASRAIASLEASLGVRLLNRTSRALSPTQEGLLYQERCAHILADLDEADETVRRTQRSPSGTLRIAISTGFGQLKVMPLVSEFLNAHQDVKVDFLVGDDHVDLVAESVDLAVRIGQLEDSALIAKRIGVVGNVLVASPDYLQRHGEPRVPGELSLHRCLARRGESFHRDWTLISHDGETQVGVAPKIILGSNAELLNAARAGLGITKMLEMAAAPYLETKALVRILPDVRLPDLPLHLVFPEGGNRVAKTRALIEFLEKRIKSDPSFR